MGSWAESEQNQVTYVGTCGLWLHKPLSVVCKTPYEINVIQVIQVHTIGLNRLWRIKRPCKVNSRQTEHAKRTPSH